MKEIVASVTTRITSEQSYDEIRDSISHDLLAYLNNQKIKPVLIPNNPNLALSMSDNTDMLILTGGNSVEVPNNFTSSERDYYQSVMVRNSLTFSLIDKFIKESKPIFGICHGMQIINKYFGGKNRKTFK